MGYTIVQQGDTVSTYNMEIQCKTKQELENLPQGKFAPGSTCLVLEDSSVYRLGDDQVWYEL